MLRPTALLGPLPQGAGGGPRPSLDSEEAHVPGRGRGREEGPGAAGSPPPGAGGYIQKERQRAGLSSRTPAAAEDPQKKRRKKCGGCVPCLRKDNCGTCGSCLNRQTGKQICKMRKCVQLNKRRNDPEAEYFEETNRSCFGRPDQTVKTVLEADSLDGPRRGGQMEIGSHDRLQEGMLSLERANGARRYPNNEDPSTESEQQRAGSIPPGQDKFGDPQQQLSCWKSQGGAAPGEPVHQADMEDARNLVAFSASLGSLAPSSSSCTATPVKPNPTKLYEKFSQEMDSDGLEARPTAGTPKGGVKSPEDINTLQTALSQAKHGHKPPNCDCDGPDCPDYLEWLQKKIKMAANEDNMPCKIKRVAPHLQQPDLQQPHHFPQPQHPMNGAHSVHTIPTPYQQHQGHQGSHPGTLPCTKAPIPCSPQVLSIAKEKNVSLQTAIAIEALTQLSGTGPQAAGSQGQASMPGHIHQHYPHAHNHPSKPQNGNHFYPSSQSPLLSSRSQSVPPGLNPSQEAMVSWEQNRPQSQGQPAHTSPLPSSNSCFPSQGKPPGYSPHPQQWQEGSGAGPTTQRNQWMPATSAPPNISIDPMSELKQLLGDTSGKLGKARFKHPVQHQYSPSENFQAQGYPGSARIKQEPDSGEYYHNIATMGHYGKMNGQQGQHYSGPPLSPGQAAICHSTQAALQQHLTYKRNLFSNHAPGFGGLDERSPSTCQNLKKWWPQVGPEGINPLTIKQEAKEPKKKKTTQSKSTSGVLAGPQLPKPKPIVIKKTKQKASLPTFLPQNQISVQKPSPHALVRAPFQASLPAGSFPSLPLPSLPSQAVAAGLPAPASSQVSTSSPLINTSSTAPALLDKTPAPMGPPIQPAGSETHLKRETDGTAPTDSSTTPTITTPLTSTSSTSQLPSLNHVDPKYEDLMLQFEAEFGDSPAPVLPASQPMEQVPTVAKAVESECHVNANSGPDGFSLSSNGQADPLGLSAPPSSEPNPAGQEMEVDANKTGSQCEAASSLPSEVDPAQEQHPRDQALSLQSQQAHLEQQQPKALEDPFNMPFSPLPKRMKIETSGGLAVLSTTCYSEEDTPTKDSLPCSPSLRGFLESPLRYLDTPTKNLLDTPAKDLQAEFPICDCVEQILEKDEGPYYNHLGSGPTVASIRELMETRYGEKGEAVRIEKVVYTGREGKSSRGCPIAKWVVRRGSETEKLMCLVRHRMGHHCANAVIIILIMAWEGVPAALGDKLYRELSDSLTQFGNPTSRRCGLNDDRTCACQGRDSETCGASFSFGCSWSMYFNGCKYARSKIPRKFRLQGERPEEEDKLRDNFQELATEVAPLYKQLAPQAFSNQCLTESSAPQCRLGLKEGKPFSGVTACMDFCAHSHKDQHNLSNGCTVVCTLTKEANRQVGVLPEDEQLHVLPLYRISTCDEYGSEEGQRLKMKTGALQVLQAFRREVRKLPEPAKSCRQRRLEAKKAASEKKKGKLQAAAAAGETPEKTVVKVERVVAGSPHPQGNKTAVVKQEMKPIIKKEHFKGSMEGYPAQADPYNVYPHPAFYARGGLSSNDQPSPNGPVNGYHPNLTALPFGYYNYPQNALFRPQMRTYEGIRGTWSKAGSKGVQEDKKPDVQSLQAQLAQSCPQGLPEQQHPEVIHQRSAYPQQQQQQQQQQPEYNQSRPSSVSSEHSNRGNPLIKQEPMDVPVYEGTTPGQSAANTPSTTPQPGAWPGHMPGGTAGPLGWDEHGNPRPGPVVSPFTPNKQQFYQQPPQLPSPYAQQWTSFPNSNTSMASPAPSPSPSLKIPPSPSPSPQPSTPRPSTPQAGVGHSGLPHSGTSHPGTPQPGTPRPGTPGYWPSPAPSPQPNPWGMEPAGYNPALKHSHPSGAYPGKMWHKAGENRSSTPLGLQENAWKSCGGSAAGSTPSPAPEGRQFPDSLQQSEQAFWDPAGRAESDADSVKGHEDDDEVFSDSEHNFLDPNIGGVAVAPAHGSVLIECARRELHATTPLKRPDRSHPTRISLVFYQHKNLNQPHHGLAIWEAKMKLLAEKALQRQQEAALMGYSAEEIKALGKKRKLEGLPARTGPGGLGLSMDKREGPVTRLAPTLHTTSTVTVSPYAFTQLTGPYSRFV